MNGPVLVRPAIFTRFSLWAALLILLLVFPLSGMAQEADGGDEPAPSAGGQAVDEEEAEFRRRMELEEADEGDLPASANLPPIIEMDPMADPDDTLPPQSRDHLDEELTQLIIENGRWEPQDAERPAPYTPSEAAEQDPELAAEEQAAWDEAVAAYHERERAAWEQAGGQSDGASGQGSGQGSGSGGGNGNGGGAGSGSGAGQAGEPTSGGVGGSEERPPQGEPFNALEFLGGAPEPMDSDPGEAAEGGAATGEMTTPSGQSSGPDTGDESEATDPDPGESSDAPPEQTESEPKDSDPTESDALESEPTEAIAGSPSDTDTAPPPGSVPSDAFDGLFELSTSTTETVRESAGSDASATNSVPAPEGAEANGTQSPQESSQQNSSQQDSSQQDSSQQDSSQQDSSQQDSSQQDSSQQDSPRQDSSQQQEPPKPSFLDWLFGLFAGDEEPEEPGND